MTLATNLEQPAAIHLIEIQRARLWLKLLRATQMIETEIRRRLREQFELTIPQFEVMAALSRTEAGMTMSDLSYQLMVSNGNVTGIINRLKKRGVALRQASHGDHRFFMVRLTQMGAARFAAASAAYEEWIDECLFNIDFDKLNNLIGDFDRIAQQVQRQGHRCCAAFDSRKDRNYAC